MFHFCFGINKLCNLVMTIVEFIARNFSANNKTFSFSATKRVRGAPGQINCQLRFIADFLRTNCGTPQIRAIVT